MNSLHTSPAFRDRISIGNKLFQTAISRVQPEQAILEHLVLDENTLTVGKTRVRLDTLDRIMVLGCGKASGAMALAVERILGSRIDDGLIITSDGNSRLTQYVEIVEASHPVPDERGLAAAKRLVNMAESADADTLVLFLLSGGASALLTHPLPSISLPSIQDMTTLLLRAGASIQEINTIRKQLSSVKGGKLAEILYPATVMSLVISDVIGSPPSIIGSGPTSPEISTLKDARKILECYHLVENIEDDIRDFVCSDSDINLTEDHPCFQRTSYHIIAESRDALNAAAAQAQVLGFDTSIISDKIEGEARTTAHEHLNMILPLLSSQQPQCFLFGGETTVTVTGNGLGGRNQEYILSLIDKIQEMDGLFIMSSGTDGIDGPTDAAGAWIDGSSSMRAERRRLEPLQTLANNDAYNFFKALNQLIITGPTGTNVMDIAIYLWFPR